MPNDVILYANVTLGEGHDLQPPCIIGKPPRGAGEGERVLIIGAGAIVRPFTTIYAGSVIGDMQAPDAIGGCAGFLVERGQ